MSKNIFKEEKGSVLVEFSLTLPLILLLVFGYIFIMNAVTMHITIQTTAREGARTYANPVYGVDMNSYTKEVVSRELQNNDIKGANIKVFADGYDRAVLIEKPYSTRFPLNNYILRGYAVFHSEPYDN